MVMETRNDKD